MTDIINYKHSFDILGRKAEVVINHINGLWTCDPISEWLAVGTCSGGREQRLEDYIKKIEQEHRYAYAFHSNGYKYAKENFKP
jgi:hypothetical protein